VFSVFERISFQEKYHENTKFIVSKNEKFHFLEPQAKFQPSMNRVIVPARQETQPGGIDPSESILGLLKSLKIRALLTEPK
jgi:hypothetical protein